MNNGVFFHGLTGIDIICVAPRGTRIRIAHVRLIERDRDVAHGEDVVRGLRIGEVREGTANDERRDEHDCDGSHKNGFLLHM